MGENTARVVMLVVTAALGGGAARFSHKLPKLPGFHRAAAQAEAQGVRLSSAAEVAEVAAPAEGTFTLMVRSPGSSAAAAAERLSSPSSVTGAATGRSSSTASVGTCRPASPSRTSRPETRWATNSRLSPKRWLSSGTPADMTFNEKNAVELARTQGEHWKANLLEREARGRYVHRAMQDRFKKLEWNPKGIDVIDPKTGYKYELLTRTESNMARHGRRMSEELFRMIGF